MTEDVDAGEVIDRRFTKISDTDTARSLYEKAEMIGYKLFEDNLPKLISKQIEYQCTPQCEMPGPRYVYDRNSIDQFQFIPIEKIRNKTDELYVYDNIRALDFPPFDPAYTLLNGKKVYLSMTGHSDISER
jgi:methionyl-tRNA formyltransferase